jgi:hypothetical protein
MSSVIIPDNIGKSFTVFANSESGMRSKYPGNSLSDFRFDLNSTKNLSGEWRVAALRTTFPNNFLNVTKQGAQFCVQGWRMIPPTDPARGRGWQWQKSMVWDTGDSSLDKRAEMVCKGHSQNNESNPALGKDGRTIFDSKATWHHHWGLWRKPTDQEYNYYCSLGKRTGPWELKDLPGGATEKFPSGKMDDTFLRDPTNYGPSDVEYVKKEWLQKKIEVVFSIPSPGNYSSPEMLIDAMMNAVGVDRLDPIVINQEEGQSIAPNVSYARAMYRFCDLINVTYDKATETFTFHDVNERILYEGDFKKDKWQWDGQRKVIRFSPELGYVLGIQRRHNPSLAIEREQGTNSVGTPIYSPDVIHSSSTYEATPEKVAANEALWEQAEEVLHRQDPNSYTHVVGQPSVAESQVKYDKLWAWRGIMGKMDDAFLEKEKDVDYFVVPRPIPWQLWRKAYPPRQSALTDCFQIAQSMDPGHYIGVGFNYEDVNTYEAHRCFHNAIFTPASMLYFLMDDIESSNVGQEMIPYLCYQPVTSKVNEYQENTVALPIGKRVLAKDLNRLHIRIVDTDGKLIKFKSGAGQTSVLLLFYQVTARATPAP